MPTYEYQCKDCGHKFDLFQKVSDPAPDTCPECQSGPIQKIYTTVGIIFKGSGFHVNDYRKEKPVDEKADASKASEKTESPAEKTEAPSKDSPPASAPPGGAPASSSEGTSSSQSAGSTPSASEKTPA